MQTESEINIVKQACQDLGIRQKDLAIYFGVNPKAVSDWATKRVKIPKHFQLIIDLIKYKNDCLAFKRSLGITIKD